MLRATARQWNDHLIANCSRLVCGGGKHFLSGLVNCLIMALFGPSNMDGACDFPGRPDMLRTAKLSFAILFDLAARPSTLKVPFLQFKISDQ